MDTVPAIPASAAAGTGEASPALRQYGEGDDPTRPEGLPCRHSHNGCKYIGRSWGAIIGHERLFHGHSYASLKGSYLYQMGTVELNAKQTERYQKKRREDKKNEPTESARKGKATSKKPATSQDVGEDFTKDGGAASKLEQTQKEVSTNPKEPIGEKSKTRNEERDAEPEGEQKEGGNRPKARFGSSAENSRPEVNKHKTRKDKIPEGKRKLYEEFTLPRDEGYPRRLKVDDSAHEFMQSLLNAWQRNNRTESDTLPTSSEWYLDARVECIKAGLLTKKHSPDVVKSYLKHFIYEREEKHRKPAAETSSTEEK